MPLPVYDYLLFTDQAYRMPAAIPVASGDFQTLQWSGGGKFLLATAPGPEDGPSPTTQVLIAKSDGTVVTRLTLPASGIPVGIGDDGTAWFYGVATSQGAPLWAIQKSRVIPLTLPEGYSPFGAMPEGDFAAYVGRKIILLSVSGRVREIEAPYKLVYMEPGGRLISFEKENFQEFDRKSGRWGPMPKSEPGPYQVHLTKRDDVTRANLKGFVKQDATTPLARYATGLVCADVSRAELAPTRDTVAYVSRGALLFRKIERVDRDLALADLAEREKRALMERAKRLAVGALLLAADTDDLLPADWAAKMDPYLKDAGARTGFVATFSGGNLRDIDNPSSTQLGFVSGAGGRAILFLDGSVKWEPNPK